jgi:hypothetical protein
MEMIVKSSYSLENENNANYHGRIIYSLNDLLNAFENVQDFLRSNGDVLGYQELVRAGLIGDIIHRTADRQIAVKNGSSIYYSFMNRRISPIRGIQVGTIKTRGFRGKDEYLIGMLKAANLRFTRNPDKFIEVDEEIFNGNNLQLSHFSSLVSRLI